MMFGPGGTLLLHRAHSFCGRAFDVAAGILNAAARGANAPSSARNKKPRLDGTSSPAAPRPRFNSKAL